MRITLQVEQAIRPLSDEQLGKAFREYVAESNHQSWEAWTKRDLRGMLAFFRDFTIFLESTDEDPNEHYYGEGDAGRGAIMSTGEGARRGNR